MKISTKRLFSILLSLVLVLGLVPRTSLTAYAVDGDLTISDLVTAMGNSEFDSSGTKIKVDNGDVVYFQGGEILGYGTNLTYDTGSDKYQLGFNSGSNLPVATIVLDSNNYITAFLLNFSGTTYTFGGTSEKPFEKASSPSGDGDSSSDTSSKSNTTESHTHSYSWEDVRPATEDDNGEMVYRCSCGEVLYRVPTSAYYVFNKNAQDKIKNAKQGATVKIETSRWISFHKMVMQALADRPDVTLEISFLDGEYKGNRVTVTIPAGTDALSLLDENGFVGFLYLASKYGYTLDN